ncbi:MAG: hypothetical protein RBT47_00650 [Anaerolineae bacterium]|jgi:uncharacterized phage infection (PIP) family protein YhgE|nr:hypothetical protein [Anaerolineae bacterium]
MELTQLEQMVRWLDEERKKDKVTLAAFQERLEQQILLTESQAREMDRLRQDIATLRIDLNRTNDYPAMIEKSQQDLSSQFEALKDQLRREKADTERLRQAEIEGLNQQLADVDKRLRILPRLEERLQAREAGEQQLQTQTQQLANSMADLGKRAEDRFQSVVYLEEQRRADARRIAAIEGDIPPLRKATDESIAKTVRLEDSLRKLTSRIEEAVQTTKTYDAKIEELRVADFQREQRMRQYAEQAAKVETETSRLLEQTQKYALLYNQNKQAMDGLESFRARLEKRQNEIAEMQRLNEERLARQWEEWQGNFARDWQKRLVAEEDHWRRQELDNQKTIEQLADLTEETTIYYKEIAALWESQQGVTDRWNKAIRDALSAGQENATQHAKELRRFAEEKRKNLL